MLLLMESTGYLSSSITVWKMYAKYVWMVVNRIATINTTIIADGVKILKSSKKVVPKLFAAQPTTVNKINALEIAVANPAKIAAPTS
jgi:hypothetical protein